MPESDSVARIMTANIPLPPKLEMDGCLSTNWKRFKRNWSNYKIASRLNKEPKELRAATLLTCIGPAAMEVFDGFEFSEGEDKNIDTILQKFEEYCVGTTNEIYERYKFNSRVQEDGESIDKFITALRRLAKTCNYGALAEHMIREGVNQRQGRLEI